MMGPVAVQRTETKDSTVRMRSRFHNGQFCDAVNKISQSGLYSEIKDIYNVESHTKGSLGSSLG